MMDCSINWGEMELINIVKLLRMFGYVAHRASLLFQPISVAKMAVSHRPSERFLYCKDGAF